MTETSMGVGVVGRGEGFRIGLRLRDLIEVIYIVVFVTIFIYKIFSKMQSKLFDVLTAVIRRKPLTKA